MLFDISKAVHIVAGFTALILFWIPIVTKKGGKTHNRVGWVYVAAMYIVSISALVMAVWRIFFDTQVDEVFRAFSMFLIFIAILSAATAWYGIRVLKFKTRKTRHRAMIDYFFALALLLSGVAISIYGFMLSVPLLSYFPFLGIILGVSQLKYWMSPPDQRMHWLYEHLGSMIGCSIATITAFTVFGAPRLLGISGGSLFLWFLPTFLLVPVIVGFSRYYKKKYLNTSS